MNRRTALKVVAATPVLAAFVYTEPEIAAAHQQSVAALASGVPFEPKFFTTAEWRTVRFLSDLIIPRDERSGSATDVGVPEFMDFMMMERSAEGQKRMRDGLAWLDAESIKRYGRIFAALHVTQYSPLLDEISWPKRAPEALKDGVNFFVSFRNLVLSGFWSSKPGVDDLEYKGNTFVPRWEGCPPAALAKLGVSYNE
jgi:hypothetical protein